MKLTQAQLWQRFQRNYFEFPAIGLALDLSRMNFSNRFFAKVKEQMDRAFETMSELEDGAIANPDEKRMVGHYWLRNPALAPAARIRTAIEQMQSRIASFTSDVHRGVIRGGKGRFKRLLVIGIGGSALGPQFVSSALGNPATDKIEVSFFDNTDPDGMDRVLSKIRKDLGRTLCLVISKSGGTKETRNGMLEAKHSYEKAGLDFAKHAVAVTGVGGRLDQYAAKEGWLSRFPMWEWVGGRTSELSAVGLLPAALQGLDYRQMLEGAKACDQASRVCSVRANPSALLALMWYCAGNGKGLKDMVIMPYKDRLELFSRYLQQLVMESLGKELDLDGHVVNQGITVFGNKGSTDQHAFVQQLRDGKNDFFVTFVEILRDRLGDELMVEPEVTSGDYLNGFLQGTRAALYEKNRESISLIMKDLSPFSVGVLIALYERAVGLYASLININPYHQPGVEAGKKAAGTVIECQHNIMEYLHACRGQPKTVDEIAVGIEAPGSAETVFKVCEHLAANPKRGLTKKAGPNAFRSTYCVSRSVSPSR